MDEGKTDTVSATVDYQLGDEVQESERETLTGEVQVLDDHVVSTDGVEQKEFPGWALDHIQVGEESYATLEELPATVADGSTIVLVYEPSASATVPVSYEAQTGGSVTNEDGDTIQIVTADGLEGSTATASYGYKFDGWYNGDDLVTAKAELTPDLAKPALNTDENGNYAETTFTAHFSVDFSDFSVAEDEWTYNGSSRQITVNGVYAGDKLTYTSSNGEVLATCDVTADGIVNAPEFLNVSDSDTVTVTVTRSGKTASAEATMTITPLTITVTPRDIRKTQGQADPALTSDYSGYLQGETAGWTGALTREPGEAVGTYTISQGSLQLADNPDGNFLAQNYILVVNEGTFTIVAAPGGGGTPTPTPGGGGDGTPTPGTPATVTPADDTTTDEAAPEETIADDDTALAAPTDTIGDDDTPLAAGAKDEDCWVHWLILLGMILSAVYFVGVGVRRRKFTSSLLGYEDKVLGNDRDNA